MEILFYLLILILVVGVFIILRDDNEPSSYTTSRCNEPNGYKPNFILRELFEINKRSLDNAINTKRPSGPSSSTNRNTHSSSSTNKTSHETSSLFAKGTDYERFIANQYELKGYKVSLHGILKGKKDGGIDIICTKDNQMIFIQCKNWESHHRWKINHEKLKSFIGSCTEYVNENRLFGKEFKFLYMTSNDILDNSAKAFLKNSKTLKHQIISFNK